MNLAILLATSYTDFVKAKNQLLSDSTLFGLLVHSGLLAICAEAHH